MEGLNKNSAVPLNLSSILEPSSGSAHQSSQTPPLPPTLAQDRPHHIDGWRAICEQQEFYDDEGYLCLSRNLTSEGLKDRKVDDVVIFDYSLSREDGNPAVEGNRPSSGGSSEDDDRFFRMPKDMLIESEQFSQVVNPTKQPRLIQSRARLAIIDFAQCYDTSDENLLNSMAKVLHLSNPATFGGAHSRRVLALPGRGRFRTGFSLRVSPRNQSELAKPGPSEDRITLFVSFPYFGKASSSIPLGPESESVKLLDFKRLEVDVPDRRAVVNPEDEAIADILVHQARYMIFDNHTMATFRSKEDGAKNQVPLHHLQERAGAFHAMVHMTANPMDGESWIFEKLQAYLCKLEEDIDKMISDAKTYEDNQGMERISADNPVGLAVLPGVRLTGGGEEEWRWYEYHVRARQENVGKRKQRRTRDLIASLNMLSASLLAAISVAERQIAVLQNLHDLFFTSCGTKTEGYENGHPLRENPFYKNIAPIPILSEGSNQMWPNTLGAIGEVVRERKCFIQKVKELVENMDIRRKILSAFLKSDQAKAASSERTAQEATEIMKRTEDTLKTTLAEIVQQKRTVDGFTFITLAFLPLNFCTSYFGMQTVKEFGGSTAEMSVTRFWHITIPLFVGILLLTVIVIVWNRDWAKAYRKRLKEVLWSSLWAIVIVSDPEAPSPQEQATAGPNSQEQPMASLPLPGRRRKSKQWGI